MWGWCCGGRKVGGEEGCRMELLILMGHCESRGEQRVFDRVASRLRLESPRMTAGVPASWRRLRRVGPAPPLRRTWRTPAAQAPASRPTHARSLDRLRRSSTGPDGQRERRVTCGTVFAGSLRYRIRTPEIFRHRLRIADFTCTMHRALRRAPSWCSFASAHRQRTCS